MKNNNDGTAKKPEDNTAWKFEIAGGQDLPDTPEDLKKMQPEIVTIDLPDVADIPGQENIHPAPLGELADTTISSADEEGDGLFDDDDLLIDDNDDVVTAQKKSLQEADEDMPGDDKNLRRTALDNEDEEGIPLNEEGFGLDITGKDLDIPGTEEDDANEEIGEEDEENNAYSNADN